MAINWFPGHMFKAKKEIIKIMNQVDLIIEVLDARIPFSSENPMVPELRGNTPCLKVLNKSDLADAATTALWMEKLEQEEGITAIALTQKQPATVRSILSICEKMMPDRNLEKTPLRAIILGIPNVGKSTLINTLVGRTVAKTGNEPAVTKTQQRIRLPNNIVLHDTPGFLWPKLEPEECGYRLAVTGAIKDTVVEYEDVAMFLAEFMLENYPDILCERFQLDELPETEIELLEAIGARRGCLRKGGRANLHKVSEILLHEFRNGALGRLSLETPEMIEAEAKIIEAQRQAQQKLEDQTLDGR
ncbi:MAG: ribosome biogenesis GTPase A [Phenylobacterium sp.]|jgi:ribosome biogenesis GTPase A